MKYLIKITLAFIVGISILAACNDNDDTAATGFSLDKEDITIGAEGGTDNLTVSSSSKWVATSTEPWVMISPANGIGATECVIKIDSTLINGKREAIIRFTPEGQPAQTIKLIQLGYDKMIYFEDNNKEIEASEKADKRFFEMKVTTNVEFDIKIKYENEKGEETVGEWLSTKNYKIELDAMARPRTAKIRFDWKMNPDAEKRIAKVEFVPTKEGDKLKEPVVLTVTQKAAPKIEDNRSGDSLAVIMIRERLECYGDFDSSENMRNWTIVTLWEATDKELPSAEAIGRIRSASFTMINTKESLPQEVRFLKYVQKLNFSSNTNTAFLSIDLTSDICELNYLKDLAINAYGLISLPKDFNRLGKSLEKLNLGSNNFNQVPPIITKENFPKLKSLQLTNNRRWDGITDLRDRNNPKYQDGIGLYLDLKDDITIRNLFLWDTLEELRLSYCYIEGQLPTFEVGQDGITAYSNADVAAFGGDTIQWLADNNQPKILPNMKRLSINLNYLTGNLPDWILNHPHLMDWNPEVLVFNQMEKGVNSEGKVVGFDNDNPDLFDKYYEKFPKFREKYELIEE